MFMVEIDGMRALYTGDYSRIPDRHLPGADVPQVRPDIGMYLSRQSLRIILRRRQCHPESDIVLLVESSHCGKHLWGPQSFASI